MKKIYLDRTKSNGCTSIFLRETEIIFAVDSKGGFIGAVGQEIDLESDAPICYIDEKKKCYLLAINGGDFLEKASDWRIHLQPYQEVKIYDSKSAAENELDFLKWENME